MDAPRVTGVGAQLKRLQRVVERHRARLVTLEKAVIPSTDGDPLDGEDPGAPTVTTRLGTITVTRAPVTDPAVVRSEIHMWHEDGYGPNDQTLVGEVFTDGSQLVVTTVTVGGVYYVRTVNVSRAGQRSDPSPSTEVTVEGIIGGDIEADQITANHIIAGSIEAGKIAADAFVGGEFTGGTFTGTTIQTDADPALGVKMTAAGIEAFNAGNEQVFAVDADTGDLTARGEFSTGPAADGVARLVLVDQNDNVVNSSTVELWTGITNPPDPETPGLVEANAIGTPVANLVQNPSFETNLTGWKDFSATTFARVSSTVHSGSWASRVTFTTSGSGIFQQDGTVHWVPVTAGETYTLSAWIKSTSGLGYHLQAEFLDSSGVGIDQDLGVASVVPTSGVATRYSLTTTVPANVNIARMAVVIVAPSGVNGNTFDVDAVMVTAGSTLEDYFDGASGTGYAWDGAAHASTSTAPVYITTHTLTLRPPDSAPEPRSRPAQIVLRHNPTDVQSVEIGGGSVQLLDATRSTITSRDVADDLVMKVLKLEGSAVEIVGSTSFADPIDGWTQFAGPVTFSDRKQGVKTGTTDASGNIVVTHDLGVLPFVILATSYMPTVLRTFNVDAAATTTTTCSFRVRDAANAVVASTSVTFAWQVITI